METMVKHKQELIDILMNDAKLRYAYADKYGNTCAIGGMAAAFGWEAKPLIDSPKRPYNSQGIDVVINTKTTMVRALKRAIRRFELDEYQLKDIQKTNDRFSDTTRRHEALKELVESWEDE